MATTIQNATLTVVVTETLSLGGTQYGGTKTLEIADINEVYKKVVTVPADNLVTLVNFSTNTYDSGGAVDIDDVKYVRVTNLDDTNPIEFAFVGENSLYEIRLDAGHSHILGITKDSMMAEADTTPTTGIANLEDIESIQAYSVTNACDIEIFIASV
tara:strand:+ start:641 stop:1111 length:471 start_codon:yes stop_codon:yes gene_type:complete